MLVSEDSPDNRVQSLSDVTNVLSSRHDGTCRYWWKVKSTGEVLYGKFDLRSPSPALQLRVLLFASQSPNRAAEVVCDEVSRTDWIDPMKAPFTAPAEYPCIERDQLQTVRPLTPNVDIVLFNGKKYVHKYMNVFSQPSSFECEIRNHQRVYGSRFVPELFNIVTCDRKNRGLLLEYIDGENLSQISSVLNEMQLYSMTASILDAITDFEMRGYYPQDLKCANIVSRNKDMSLFVVDLGTGFTEGMHLQEATRAFGGVSILPYQMVYTLGRTLWELWMDDIPPVDENEEAPGSLPVIIQKLVKECCLEKQFKSVAEVKEVYFSVLVALGLDRRQ